MNYTNPLFIMLLLVGIVFVLAGYIMHKFPPKSINMLYGYRTKSSMKSKERWVFSQGYSSNLMLYLGFDMMMLSILGIFIVFNETTSAIIGLSILFLCVIILVFKTEKAIKQKFSNEN